MTRIMTAAGGGTFHFSGETPEAVATGGCSGTIDCLFAATMDASVLLLAFTFVVFVAFLGLLFVPEARRLCQRERKETETERDAFDRFVRRVRQLTVGEGGSAGAEQDGPLLHRTGSPSTASMSHLTDAYRDTVMKVPHYDQYDESLSEHMAAEFGTDIAHGVVSNDRLTAPIKQSAIHAGREARDRRGQLLDALEIESDSLATHGAKLREIDEELRAIEEPLNADQSYKELTAAREVITANRKEIDEACRQRQEDRREAQLTSLRLQKDFDLQEYLYSSMDVTYPVLAEATRLLSRIKTAEHRIEDELIYRG